MPYRWPYRSTRCPDRPYAAIQHVTRRITMSLPVRRAKLRLEEKSKKVQDVIQRLRSRVCTLESMQDSLLTELMEEKANLISAIHSVENSVLGKIYDAQCSLETMFDRQKTICSNIIESANKTVCQLYTCSTCGLGQV